MGRQAGRGTGGRAGTRASWQMDLCHCGLKASELASRQ